MTYVKINDVVYEAEITGRIHDKDWNDRESKAIKLKMTSAEAASTFVTGCSWYIIQEDEMEVEKFNEETGEVEGTELITETEEYDNSEYSITGDVIDHRNGYVTVKMGKPTAEELLETKIQESNELWAEMTAAYNLGVQEA